MNADQNGQLGLPSLNVDPGKWLWDAVYGFFDRLWKQVVDFFQKQIIDWASSFGFLYITPAALTYRNPMVLSGSQWALTAMNGLVAILLVVAGYQMMAYRYLDLQEQSLMGSVAHIALAAVAANLGFYFFLPQLIELCNLLSMSFLSWTAGEVAGDVSLPLGGIDWLAQSVTWALFILIHFVVSILFVFVQIVRLAVLDVTIMLAPWWVVLLSNEYTRPWGRLGATTFFSALFVQPLQIIIVGLGAALIANFGSFNVNDPAMCHNMPQQAQQACLDQLGHASISASTTPVVLAVGIATMYVAMKVPGMLFSGAVRASIGSVNRDVAHTARSMVNGVMSLVMFNKHLLK